MRIFDLMEGNASAAVVAGKLSSEMGETINADQIKHVWRKAGGKQNFLIKMRKVAKRRALAAQLCEQRRRLHL